MNFMLFLGYCRQIRHQMLRSKLFYTPGKASTFMGDANRASVDDEVVYSYYVSNNGTTTMSNITISDNMVRTLQDSAV